MVSLGFSKREQASALGEARRELEIVVPFTTPELTRAAIQHAESLTCGLGAHIRLIRIEVTPYPLDLLRPPIPVSFLSEQLESIECAVPICPEIKVARDFEAALLASLPPHSLTILSSKRRPWATYPERLARRIRWAGHDVILFYPEPKNA